MTDHLPECIFKPENVDSAKGIRWGGRPCICDELRACEQRVRNQDIATHHADLQEAKALLASRDEAWYAGVDAAREAVELSCGWHPKGRCVECTAAIAAIDALRRESDV